MQTHYTVLVSEPCVCILGTSHFNPIITHFYYMESIWVAAGEGQALGGGQALQGGGGVGGTGHDLPISPGKGRQSRGELIQYCGRMFEVFDISPECGMGY